MDNRQMTEGGIDTDGQQPTTVSKMSRKQRARCNTALMTSNRFALLDNNQSDCFLTQPISQMSFEHTRIDDNDDLDHSNPHQNNTTKVVKKDMGGFIYRKKQ
jgi:hypothetical protein